MATVSGICDARFAAVKELLQSKLATGEELGASLVVNIDGENVVDVWGGYADAARTKPWAEDTILNVWSSSKTVVSLAALLLVDRKLLDPFEKVAKYWPEFGVQGKEHVEVRHILSHSSGVAGWEGSMTLDEVIDVGPSTARLATQAPWWTPGSASGYHTITMGHLVGELVLRITGKPMAQFVADELTRPLDADFTFGVAPADYHRVAELIAPPPPPAHLMPAPGAGPRFFVQSLLNPALDAGFAATDAWRSAAVPAVNGHSNARGLARLLSFVSCRGTVGATRLLAPETVDLIFQQQTLGPDLVIGANTRFGIGYALTGTGPEGTGGWVPEGDICFWGGWGGSMAVMDVGRRVTVTYMMNKMVNAALGAGPAKDYILEVYKILGAAVPAPSA